MTDKMSLIAGLRQDVCDMIDHENEYLKMAYGKRAEIKKYTAEGRGYDRLVLVLTKIDEIMISGGKTARRKSVPIEEFADRMSMHLQSDEEFKSQIKSYVDYHDNLDRQSMSEEEKQKEICEMESMMREIGLKEYNRFCTSWSKSSLPQEAIGISKTGFIMALVALGYIPAKEGQKMIDETRPRGIK
ncbi:MAG: hypothetical protein PHW36_00725 [Bacilli bacterium]|nr:hypothetical protein [Bacilli bacterium]